jgi:hypothetical protein
MRRLVPFLLALLALSACREREAGIRTTSFARLYVRLRVASSSREGHPERARQARDSVLRAAGTDLQGYRLELKRLQDDPDRWEAFWNEVRRLSDSIANPKKGH